tara:strand:+ start:1412 stop:1732 length:321 start_codon:yes stop_codon:yes gene_type:complete
MMDDLDIGYRIAKIDGVQCQIEQADTTHAYLYSEDLNSEYHPLTDDGLCLRLMEKYGVTFNIYHDLDGIKYYHGDLWRDGKIITITDSKDLKRFVCLYVIELNKGK